MYYIYRTWQQLGGHSTEESTETEAAIVSTLLDFQRAQCFFTLATGIASFTTIHYGNVDLWSIQAVVMTYGMIQTAAVSGILPVTLSLLQLQLLGQMSWYILSWSFVTVLLNSVLVYLTYSTKAAFDNMDEASPMTILWCSSIHPGKWCYDQSSVQHQSLWQGVRMGIAIACDVTFLAITLYETYYNFNLFSAVQWLWETIDIGSVFRRTDSEQSVPEHNTPSPPRQKPSRRDREVPEDITWVGWGLRWVSGFFLSLGVIAYGILLANPALDRQISVHEWGFAQVVALTIWIPSIIEYIWMICGK